MDEPAVVIKKKLTRRERRRVRLQFKLIKTDRMSEVTKKSGGQVLDEKLARANKGVTSGFVDVTPAVRY